ncbi:MAG: stalk domain-containing protein [Bacillota bacterium]|nr:stalk domain-containing protein [Bacillota bacterium]
MPKINKLLRVFLCFCAVVNLFVLNFIQVSALESNIYHGKRLDYKKTTPIDFKIYDYYWHEIKNGLKFVNPGLYDIKWRYETNTSSNVIEDAEGTIYFMNIVGTLFAVDPKGEKLWNRKFESLGDISVSLDGRVYAVCPLERNDTNDPLNVSVHVMNKNGNDICNYMVKNALDYYRGSGLAGDDKGNFIISTEDGICSYDEKGKLNWINTDIVKIKVLPSSLKFSNVYDIKIIDSENIIIVTDKKLYSLDSQGRVRWSINSDDFGRDIAINNQRYIHNRNGKNSEVIDSKDGHILTTVEEAKLNSGNYISRNSWNGGYYYYNTLIKDTKDKNYDSGIVSYDNNDKIKWIYNPPNGYKGHPDDIVADTSGNVYFSDFAGNLYSLDKNGNERFMVIRNNPEDIPSDLMVTKKGDIVWNSSEIGVLCIGASAISVLMNNEEVNFDNPPFIDNGTTMVPFRPVFEKLGLTIGWDSNTKTISGSNNDLSIKMQIGSKSCIINGIESQLVRAPKIQNGSSYVPLRFISETTHKEVSWDGRNKIVVIGSAEEQINYIVNQFFCGIQKKDIKGILSLLNSNSEIHESYKETLEEHLFKNTFVFNNIKVKTNLISDSKATAEITYNLMATEGFDVLSKENVNVVINFDKEAGNGWKISGMSQEILTF